MKEPSVDKADLEILWSIHKARLLTDTFFKPLFEEVNEINYENEFRKAGLAEERQLVFSKLLDHFLDKVALGLGYKTKEKASSAFSLARPSTISNPDKVLNRVLKK